MTDIASFRDARRRIAVAYAKQAQNLATTLTIDPHAVVGADVEQLVEALMDLRRADRWYRSLVEPLEGK